MMQLLRSAIREFIREEYPKFRVAKSRFHKDAFHIQYKFPSSVFVSVTVCLDEMSVTVWEKMDPLYMAENLSPSGILETVSYAISEIVSRHFPEW